MKNTSYRTQKWVKDKDLALRRIEQGIEEWIESLVADAIQDYIDSPLFEEDACEYCREAGWKEPR